MFLTVTVPKQTQVLLRPPGGAHRRVSWRAVVGGWSHFPLQKFGDFKKEQYLCRRNFKLVTVWQRQTSLLKIGTSVTSRIWEALHNLLLTEIAVLFMDFVKSRKENHVRCLPTALSRTSLTCYELQEKLQRRSLGYYHTHRLPHHQQGRQDDVPVPHTVGGRRGVVTHKSARTHI